jgi:hypothetical protein
MRDKNREVAQKDMEAKDREGLRIKLEHWDDDLEAEKAKDMFFLDRSVNLICFLTRLYELFCLVRDGDLIVSHSDREKLKPINEITSWNSNNSKRCAKNLKIS